MKAEDRPGATGGSDATQEALDALQQAALDAIGAARTMLEAAETIVRDPAAARAVVDTMSAFGRLATDAISKTLTPPVAGAETDASADEPDEPDEPSGFERIDID